MGDVDVARGRAVGCRSCLNEGSGGEGRDEEDEGERKLHRVLRVSVWVGGGGGGG